MHQCNYVILDYCKSDLSQDCIPCLILLDDDIDMPVMHFKVFASPHLEHFLNEMSIKCRNWMLSFLSDICGWQNRCNGINRNVLEQFCSMGVGPIRTSIHGVIELNGEDKILEFICMQLVAQEQRKLSEEDKCLIRSFRALDPETLRELQKRFLRFDSNKNLFKYTTHSFGVLALLSLTSQSGI